MSTTSTKNGTTRRLKLRPIAGTSRYCGPAAIAAIEGVPTDVAAQIIAYAKCGDARRGRYIRGVHDRHMMNALRLLGYYVEKTPVWGSPTLRQYVSEEPQRGYCEIVTVTNHYVVRVGRQILDNHTKAPKPVTQHWSKGKRVKSVMIVRLPDA